MPQSESKDGLRSLLSASLDRCATGEIRCFWISVTELVQTLPIRFPVTIQGIAT